MKTKLEQNLKVLSTQIDQNAEVGLIPALSLLQDNMCEYFKLLGADGLTMVPICNCFFVLAKTKIKFYKRAKWLDEIKLATDMYKQSNIRVGLVNNIFDIDGNPCVVGVQEMCAIDATNRKIRAVNTTLLPEDIELVENEYGLDFERHDETFDEGDFVGSVKIKLNNLDIYRHTNNLEYVKMIFNTFSLKEFDKLNIDEFEIHYLVESKENDELKIYKKQLGKDYLFEIRNGDRVITKAKMICL